MFEQEFEPDAIQGFDLIKFERDLVKSRSVNTLNLRQMDQQVIPFANPSTDGRVRITTPDISFLLSQPRILSIFSSGIGKDIGELCQQLILNFKAFPNIVTDLNQNEEIIDAIIDAITSIKREAEFRSFCEFILLLVSNDDPQIIDAGLLFSIRDYTEVFPNSLFEFYIQLPQISAYGRNAMVCTGTIDDIIEYCHNTGSSLAAKALHTLLSQLTENLEDINIQQYVHQIIDLINVSPTETIYYIVLSLIDLIHISISFIHTIIESGIQNFIAHSLQIDILVKPTIELIGCLANSEQTDFRKLIGTDIVPQLIALLKTGDATSDIFLTLNNCFETLPSLMINYFDDSFFHLTLSFLEDCPFSILKDAIYFVATLILFSPSEYVSTLLSYGFINYISNIMYCSITHIIMRCLDAINRVLLLSNTDSNLLSIVLEWIHNEDMILNLENLLESDIPKILQKTQYILAQIEMISNNNTA